MLPTRSSAASTVRILGVAMVWSVGATQPAAPVRGADGVVSIGARRELFVDRRLVESLDGARFRLHHPRPAELAVQLDRPWEKQVYNGISVIKDGDRFLLYYSALNRLAVAVSRDGIRWEKPRLGLIELDGNRDNSLVGTSDGKLMIEEDKPLPEIFLDRRPGVPRDERFKAFTLIETPGMTEVIGWVSGDGFAFHKLRKEPIIQTSLYGAFDGFESLFWSESEQQYVLYLRYAIRVEPPNPKDPNRRSVARMASKDLLTWEEPQPMTFGEAGKLPPDHHYNNQTTPYFRAPHIYIALSSRLAQQRGALTREQAEAADLKPARTDIADPLAWLIADCADTVMMTTRGGTHYDRLFQEALVRPGPGAENWVSRSNYTLRGLHPTGPTEMSIYVNRHNGQPSSHVRRYVFRTDGLVSIHAPFTGGSFVTPALIFSGQGLQINYATSAVGSIRVEVQDAQGAALPGLALEDCVEMFGDEISRTVKWKSAARLEKLAGHPIRLRFVMQDADLYSLRFFP
ncbi:MAG: hypothetical protein CMJ59_15635 [Planctomycetaceae bacterium]|nr:hypothetical protein [Planctomycetaceae bacterium]